MSRYRCFGLVLLLALPLSAAAEVETHPLAALPQLGVQSPGLGLDRLEWGPAALSYSTSWYAGQSQSLGLLTKDLRIPLGGDWDFNARFGMAFSPDGGLGTEPGRTELVLPYAALDWRPSDSFRLHLEVGQGYGTGFGASSWDAFGGRGWLRPGLAARRGEDAAEPAAGD